MAASKKIYYVTEPANWVIRQEGLSIFKYIKKTYKDIPFKLLPLSLRRLKNIKNQIIHFGSRNTYIPEVYKYIDPSNRIILTWYHGTDNDLQYIKLISELRSKIDIIHTSCTISRDNLIKWGFEHDKIVVIPIGIDSELFKRPSEEEKKIFKRKIGIPEKSVCIGSFQKDGDGWKEGMNPKIIKGPDIFCDAVIKLSKEYPVFVLLTGPARGYVKKRLSDNNVPFKHIYVKNFNKIPQYYKGIDYYFITSRAEGGPKALMESFISGVPLVSTNIGMIKDYCIDKENAMICSPEDTNCLINKFKEVYENKDLRQKIIENGLDTVKELDWSVIIKSYYEKIYSRYLI